MDDRTPCLVPGCRRTCKAEGFDEWICAKHWRGVPKLLRSRKNKLWARYRRRFGTTPFWEFPSGSAQRIDAARHARLMGRVWDKCRDEAIVASFHDFL